MNMNTPINQKIKTWIRRGVIVPLLCLVHTLSAQSPNPEVTVPGGPMSYEQVFSLIEQQGHVWFAYATQDIDQQQTVAVPGGTYAVTGLLDWLFDQTEYQYTVSGRHILISKREAPAALPAIEEEFIVQPYTPYETRLPVFALKSNLLYDLTTTVNLGVEIGLAPKWSIDIPVNYNAWKYGDDTRLRHWGVQPEVRYWFCNRFDGWFVGLHGHYAEFNVGGLPDWSFISENMQKNRYEGHLYGGGISAGYAFILKKRWSLEATVGLGYAHLVYDKYPCAECGTSMGRKTKDYFGPTKVGLSLIFMIK